MSDTQDKDQRTPLTLNKGKLELKKPLDSNRVRQNFTHGRSKVVTVEVKKKRVFGPDSNNQQDAREALSVDKEKAHRLKVLQDAIKAEEEAKQKALEEEKQRALEAQKAKEEAAAKAKEEQEKEPEKIEKPVADT